MKGNVKGRNVRKSSTPTRKESSSYVFDLVDTLRAPVLTFSSAWADTIPKRILEVIPIARMIALRKNEQLATDPEVVAYLYTRTLEAPMDRDWMDIYLHISCKTLEDWFGEDHWGTLHAQRKLNEWLQSKLHELRRFIYDKRRKDLKQRA